MKFLKTFSRSFKYVKLQAIGAEEWIPELHVFAGLEILEIKLDNVVNITEPWKHLESDSHGVDECSTVLEGRCFLNAIWEAWEHHRRRHILLPVNGLDEFVKLVPSERGQGRRFELRASTAFETDRGMYLVSLNEWQTTFTNTYRL